MPMTHTLPATTRVFLPMRIAVATVALVRVWQFRYTTRRSLSRLGAHHLRDIGIDALSANGEAEKPFWRD